MDFWIALRYLSMAGAAFALWDLASTAFRQWEKWTEKTRFHWFTLVGWVFFSLYSMIENTLEGNYWGSRWILNALILAMTIRALLNRGSIGVSQNLPWKRKSNEAE